MNSLGKLPGTFTSLGFPAAVEPKTISFQAVYGAEPGQFRILRELEYDSGANAKSEAAQVGLGFERFDFDR